MTGGDRIGGRRWRPLVAGLVALWVLWPDRAVAQAPAPVSPPAGSDPLATTAEPVSAPLVVGVEDVAYLPYYGVVDGAYAGFARAVLEAFAEDSGRDLVFRPLPVPRLYASLAAGQVAVKFPDNPLWRPDFRQNRTLYYSDPVVGYVDGTLVRADRRDLPIAQITRLGTVTGFTAWPWMEHIAAGRVVVVENTDFIALVRQVLTGRVDAAYANVAVVRHHLAEMGDDPQALVFRSDLPLDRGAYLLSTLTEPEVVAAFNAWMQTHSDRVTEIKTRFGVLETPERP